MFGYYKGEPTEYVIRYVRGRLVREGRGLSFFYYAPTAAIASVPMNTQDADFVFNEITANFQAVTVQGQITYRITEPRRLALLLDHLVNPRTKTFRSRDPAKLPVRIINLVQEATRTEIQRLPLEDALRLRADVARSITSRLRASADLAGLGVEALNVFVTAVRPTPEVAKALEADYRETLLKKADQAIYHRRASAVEEERKIRENELGTDIALEQERSNLVDLKVANLAKEAEADAKALEARIGPYRTIDPRTLLALGLKSLGENAAKIGNLTITPDLLSTLLGGSKE